MAWAAVRMLARNHLRRRWKAMAAIGTLFGVIAGTALALGVVAHRTGTAHSRLVAQVHHHDASVNLSEAHMSLAHDITLLPGVRESWTPRYWIGELQGRSDVVYSGLTAGGGNPSRLDEPILIRGRAPEPQSLTEVLVSEEFSNSLGYHVGSTLRLDLLNGRQLANFASLGRPAGPEIVLRVVGVGRLPSWRHIGPIMATPAFADRYGKAAASRSVFLKFPPDARQEITTAFDALATTHPQPPLYAELGPLQLTFAADNELRLITPTRQILLAGLYSAAALAALAALALAGQVLARQNAIDVLDQRVEALLGATRRERASARCLAAGLSGLIATILALAAGGAAGRVQPLGRLRDLEPQPGYLAPVGIVVAGAALVGLIFLMLAATAAATTLPSQHDRTRAVTTGTPPGAWWRGRSVSVIAGLRLAGYPTRGLLFRNVIGVGVAVALAVAVMTFTAGLDRLVRTPARYTMLGDVVVLDVTDADVLRLRADPQIASVTQTWSSSVRLGDSLVDAVALDDPGTTPVAVVSGRTPARHTEIALGSHLATQLGVRPGDAVPGKRPDGTAVSLRVVGIVAIRSQENAARLGTAALLSRRLQVELAGNTSYREAHIRAAPGQLASLTKRIQRDWEVYPEPVPYEVASLQALVPLPGLLAALMIIGAAVGTVHAVSAARRRSRRERAVLVALGASPAQGRMVLAIMAGRLVVPTVLISTVVGIGLGRLAWWQIASSYGVAGDPAYPFAALIGTSAGIISLGWATAVGLGKRGHASAVLRRE